MVSEISDITFFFKKVCCLFSGLHIHAPTPYTYTYRDTNVTQWCSHTLTGFHISIHVLTYIKKLYFNDYDFFSKNRCQGSLLVIIIGSSIMKDRYVYFVYTNTSISDIILVLLTGHQLNIHGNLASVSLQRGQCSTA